MGLQDWILYKTYLISNLHNSLAQQFDLLPKTSTYSTINESPAFWDLTYLRQHLIEHRDLIYLLHHVCRELAFETYQR